MAKGGNAEDYTCYVGASIDSYIQEYWTYTMTWYIQASNGTSFSARSSKTPVDGTNGDRSSVNGADGSEVSSGGADDEAVKAKEAALAEREQKLKDLLDQRFKAVKTKESELAEREQKVKELEQKEEAVNKKEQDLAAAEAAHKKEAEQLSSREREFASRQVAAVQGASDDSARERALLEREAELKHQLDEADKREQEFTAKEAAAAEKQKQAAAKEAELKKSEAELKRLEAELKKLRAEDAQREESVKSSTTSNEALKRMVRELQDALTTARHASSESAKSSAEAQELGKLRAEITRLKDYIVSQAMEGHKHRSPRKLADSHTTELERLRADNTRLRQQRELLKKQQKIVHGGPPKEVANAHGNGAKTFDCGHTFYPAPRKIEKKVTGFVGYLYEGLP